LVFTPGFRWDKGGGGEVESITLAAIGSFFRINGAGLLLKILAVQILFKLGFQAALR
jgi:hypothetical protein